MTADQLASLFSYGSRELKEPLTWPTSSPTTNFIFAGGVSCEVRFAALLTFSFAWLANLDCRLTVAPA